MSLQVEKMEKNMAKLTIEVAAEDLEKAMQNAYQKAKGRISIPGFRKGKAPRKMIEQMYGKGVFLEDAVNALIPEHYSKALAECELEIVSQPTIDITQAEPGKAFIFTAEVAVKPEVTLGDYKGVEILPFAFWYAFCIAFSKSSAATSIVSLAMFFSIFSTCKLMLQCSSLNSGYILRLVFQLRYIIHSFYLFIYIQV